MCTFDRVGHSRHHSAPLLAAQPSKQKEPGIVVLLISSTHHDYLTRTSSDNPQTPLYYHLIENVLPFASQIIKMMTTCSARLDKMLAKQWLFTLNVLLLNAFIYEFTTSLGAHIQLDTRVFTCYRLRDERHFTQWYAIISFALHGKTFYPLIVKPKTF